MLVKVTNKKLPFVFYVHILTITVTIFMTFKSDIPGHLWWFDVINGSPIIVCEVAPNKCQNQMHVRSQNGTLKWEVL